jgi:hypothetical protein
VQSHMTDAQFSISSGANINIVSLSGTNEFHGHLWEFFRNDVLDARNFFDASKPPYRQNQYGVTFGGPVFIPKLFNGKNNTWFEAYWEGFQSAQSLSYFSSVPTQAMRNGDFSAILGPQIGTDSLGRPLYTNEIFNPSTSRPDPTNPANIIRDPYTNNVIPASQLNPATILTLNKYYPLPNLNVGPTALNNLQWQGGNDTAITGSAIMTRFSVGTTTQTLR